MSKFRDFSNVNENVKENYKTARLNHNTILYKYILSNFEKRQKNKDKS